MRDVELSSVVVFPILGIRVQQEVRERNLVAVLTVSSTGRVAVFVDLLPSVVRVRLDGDVISRVTLSGAGARPAGHVIRLHHTNPSLSLQWGRIIGIQQVHQIN